MYSRSISVYKGNYSKMIVDMVRVRNFSKERMKKEKKSQKCFGAGFHFGEV